MTISSQDQMQLSITSSRDGCTDYVRIRGEVDLADEPALGMAADRLFAVNANIIYVDLGETTFMGSTLINFLLNVGCAECRAHRPLVVCRPTPMARKVLHICGLNDLVSLSPRLPPLWPDGTS